MNVCDCSRPTKTYLCEVCNPEMQAMTKRAEWLIRELHTTAARLDVIGSGGNIESKTVSKVAPDAVNYSATLCATEIQSLLNGLPARVKLEDIHLHPEAPWYYKNLQHRYGRGIRIIDTKPERIHLGTCPTDECGEAMNPIKGERQHVCKACGVTTYVDEYRGAKVSAAWSVTCHPPEAARILLGMGVKVQVRNIHDWIRRDDLVSVGERAGKPLYRISDIYDVAQAKAARRRAA